MLISIVTAAYNAEETIQQCIDSVKSQSHTEIEHIIVDGNSTDNTLEIVKRNNCTYISENDSGIYDAFNKGVVLAKGEIVHILNADDYYAHNDVVSKFVKHMNNNSLDLLHAQIEQFSETKSKIIGRSQTKLQMLNKMRVVHPSVFVRRDVYEKFGCFSVGFKIAGDHEFLLRVWDKLNIGYCPEVIVMMKMGGASNSQISKSYKESMAAAILHGKQPVFACYRFYWELFKNKVLQS